MKIKNRFIFLVLAGVLAVLTFFLAHLGGGSLVTKNNHSSGKIKVVAVENFYGDVARQLGADHIELTSILVGADIDPHEYEPTVQDAVAISEAQIVIMNGLGYDSWVEKLLKASPKTERIVIVAGEVAPRQLPNNPHVWYGVDNMAVIAQQIAQALGTSDPVSRVFFNDRLTVFLDSLTPLEQAMSAIKTRYNGTPIGLTETIFLYQTGVMGLVVKTPTAFAQAIAAGNDPSVDSVRAANNQIEQKQIKILVLNGQTATPITNNLRQQAMQKNIPVVAVTETMPAQASYQSWMMGQLQALDTALQQAN